MSSSFRLVFSQLWFRTHLTLNDSSEMSAVVNLRRLLPLDVNLFLSVYQGGPDYASSRGSNANEPLVHVHCPFSDPSAPVLGTGVTDDDDSGDGLSVGGLIGIVFSSIVVLFGGGYLLKIDALHIHCCRSSE